MIKGSVIYIALHKYSDSNELKLGLFVNIKEPIILKWGKMIKYLLFGGHPTRLSTLETILTVKHDCGSTMLSSTFGVLLWMIVCPDLYLLVDSLLLARHAVPLAHTVSNHVTSDADRFLLLQQGWIWMRSELMILLVNIIVNCIDSSNYFSIMGCFM